MTGPKQYIGSLLPGTDDIIDLSTIKFCQEFIAKTISNTDVLSAIKSVAMMSSNILKGCLGAKLPQGCGNS